MRSGVDWVFAVIAVVALLAWYLSYTAARLDRLHARVEGSLSALDAQLVRRAEATLELANSGALDPASALLLASAASDSLEAGDERYAGRESIESDLTEVLTAAITPDLIAAVCTEVGRPVSPIDSASSPEPVEPLETVEPVDPDGLGGAEIRRVMAVGQRVQLARRFHNDAVTDVRRVRRKAVVRVFRLAGHAELPRTVEFHDALPGTPPPE